MTEYAERVFQLRQNGGTVAITVVTEPEPDATFGRVRIDHGMSWFMMMRALVSECNWLAGEFLANPAHGLVIERDRLATLILVALAPTIA